MIDPVYIAGSYIGNGHPVVICGELGINFNGDISIAKKMIDIAVDSKLNCVKTQKRTIEIVYSPEELSRPRDSIFGNTNGDLKRGLELNKDGYDELDAYCKDKSMTWLSSSWDEASVDFIAQYDPPAFKIASACLTDDALLRHHRQYKKPIILSTGMSTIPQIDRAVDILGTDDLILLHCCSVYPARSEQLNLRVIETLKARYGVQVGYSGHETGLATTVVAVAMGATMIERHLTLDRAMFGSDQAASVEGVGMKRLVRDIREIEKARGDGVKRVLEQEKPIIQKLRRVDTMKLEG